MDGGMGVLNGHFKKSAVLGHTFMIMLMTEHTSALTGSLNRALGLPAKLALCSQHMLNLRDLQHRELL